MELKEKIEVKTVLVTKTAMDLYREWDVKEKEAKAEKEKLREDILKNLRKASDPWYSYSVTKKTVKVDPFLIYEWVKGIKKVPRRLLESLATHSLSDEALDTLLLAGYYEPKDIPESCYTVSGGSEVVKVRAEPKE